MKPEEFNKEHLITIVQNYHNYFAPDTKFNQNLDSVVSLVKKNAIAQTYIIGSRWSGTSALGFKRNENDEIIPYFDPGIQDKKSEEYKAALSIGKTFERVCLEYLKIYQK